MGGCRLELSLAGVLGKYCNTGEMLLNGAKDKGRGQANTVVNKIYEIVAAAAAAPRQVGSGQWAADRGGGGGGGQRKDLNRGNGN